MITSDDKVEQHTEVARINDPNVRRKVLYAAERLLKLQNQIDDREQRLRVAVARALAAGETAQAVANELGAKTGQVVSAQDVRNFLGMTEEEQEADAEEAEQPKIITV